MADFIVMPKLGFDMREGEFNAWLKEIGDSIERGEVVAEIESDKATLELEAQVTGTLLATLVDSGDIVAVGANVGIVGEEGEDISGLLDGEDIAPSSNGAKAEEAAPAEQPEATSDAPAQTQPAAAEAADTTASAEFPAGVKATPVARRMAEDNDVNLLHVPFEGERIRKADVEAYIEAGKPAPEAQPEAAAPAAGQAIQITPTAVEAGDDDTLIPTTRLRQAIARRMLESKTTVPHFYVTMEIDMGPAMKLRKELNTMLESDGIKISVNDLLVKAAGLALRDFPALNSSFAGENIVQHNRINVGSAVATEKGLLTVVQKDTDKTTLSEVAKENREMIGRAREGKISPDDVSGGTFTISNLGIYGVEDFVAIINPPDAAILAIGGLHKKPVVVDNEIVVGQRMKVTISADHRVSDGAEAAEFLVKFKELLENPMRLLV